MVRVAFKRGFSLFNHGDKPLTLSFKSIATALVVLFVAPAAFAAGTLTTVTTHEKSISNYHTMFSDVYVAGKVGQTNPTGGELDGSVVYSGAVGYHYNDNIRIEGELAYRTNDISDAPLSGEARTSNLMLNGWYDFANTTKFTPYVGGGVGVAHNQTKAQNLGLGVYSDNKDYALAYQLGGGVAYELCKNLDLTADYRFLDTNKFKNVGDFKAHEVSAGVRYSF